MFSLPMGRLARDSGMDAVKKRGRIWYDKSVLHCSAKAERKRGKILIGEVISKWARDKFGKPHHSNCYSTVTAELERLGFLHRLAPTEGNNQLAPMRKVSSHARDSQKYRCCSPKDPYAEDEARPKRGPRSKPDWSFAEPVYGATAKIPPANPGSWTP
jgi:hypothetical protein